MQTEPLPRETTQTRDLHYIRGRLRFDAAVSWARPGLTACEFADFLPDTLENRVLRATLEVLATRRLLPGIRLRLEQVLRRFQCVALVRPDGSTLSACRINRLNQGYAPAILGESTLEITGTMSVAGCHCYQVRASGLKQGEDKALELAVDTEIGAILLMRRGGTLLFEVTEFRVGASS
jgi:hypothetical protein